MELKDVLKWRQEADGFNKYLGIRVMDIGIGTSEVEVDVTPELVNPLGVTHGGAVYSLCDVAAGSAAASRGRVAVTLSGVINYLRPGPAGQLLRGFANEIKSGRTTAVYVVEVLDEADKLVATATFTMYYTGKTVEDMQCLAD